MQENNQEELLDELNEVLGEDNKDTDIEELVKHLGKIKDRMNINEKFIDGLYKLINQNTEVKEYLENLTDEVKGKTIKLPDTFDVNVQNPVNKVTVDNISEIKIPEPLKELKVNNLKDIPNYKSDIKALAELQSAVVDVLLNKELKTDLDRYLDPKRALAVRLSDGKKFYEAISSAISTAMEVFVNSAGTPKSALVDASGHLQVDVLSGGGGGTLVTDGEAVDVADTGQMVLGTDGSNYQTLSTDADGHLQVDILTGAGGTQYTEGDTDATITGTAMLGEMAGDTLGTLQLDALKSLKTTLLDSGGFDLEFVKQADNYAAANHGIIMYGVDDGTPQKYRQLRMDTDGRIETHLTNVAHDQLDFNVADFDTGGGTDNIATFGIALPASGGAVIGGTATDPICVDTELSAAAVLDTNSATPTTSKIGAFLYGRNPVDGNWEFINSLDSGYKVASGPLAAGLVAQFDDASIATTTENQFSPLRISPERHLYVELRDGAGNERGMNVDANGNIGAVIGAGTNAIGKLLPKDVDVTANTNHIQKTIKYTGAQTDTIVWSPAAGKRWHVVSISFQTSADATIIFEDDLTGGDSHILGGEYKAGGGLVQYFGEEHPLASGEDAADLLITTSAGNLYVTLTGYEI